MADGLSVIKALFEDFRFIEKASHFYRRIALGYAFESLCYKHLRAIKTSLGIGAVYTEILGLHIFSKDQEKGFQIDLIIDRKDDTINLCEIKFHASTFTIDKSYYQQLLRKKQAFIEYTKTKKQVFLTFITNHGITKNAYVNEIVDAEVLLEDLMEVLRHNA